MWDICQQGRESTLGTLGKKAEGSMRRGTEQTLWPQTDCTGCWHEGGTEKQGKNPKRFLKRGQELCRKKYQPTEKGTRPRRSWNKGRGSDFLSCCPSHQVLDSRVHDQPLGGPA